MKLKKIVAILLCLVLAFSMLTACGSSSSSSSSEASSDSDAATSDAPSTDNPITLSCATLFAEGHPVVDRMYVFAETIAEQTDGAINIKIYPSDTLGDSTVCFEEVMKGTIDMTFNAGTDTYSELFMLPLLQYLASNYDEAEELYASGNYLYNLLSGVAEENNLKFLGFDFVGIGGLGFTKEPSNYTDWGTDKGVLIRVPAMDIASVWAEDMGFRTVNINYSDLYTSLQTGVCEGWSGGQPTVNYQSFGDVIKYYVQDDDFIETNGIYINMDLWNTFTEEQQEIFMNAAAALYQQSFEDLQEDTDYYLDAMEEIGIEVTILTDDEKAALAEKTREVTWPYFEDSMGADTFAAMIEAYDFLQY